MNDRITHLIAILMLLTITSSCGDDPEYERPAFDITVAETDPMINMATPLWERHHDTPLKILCIGNSFTNNATTYMPWLIERLNADSICLAKLTRSGCSLQMHWQSHLENTEDYSLHYSDQGEWKLSDVKTIDRALTFFDWDIITIQQVSGRAGVYTTYQPYLANLLALFKATDPDASLAWHYTWAYTPWTNHPDFKIYDHNSEKMYQAIMEACDRASEEFDIRIPSADLIKMMREEFPKVENGFSEDGYHISDSLALFALSSLWYDVTVSPTCGTCRQKTDIPSDLNAQDMEKVEEIIVSILKPGYGME
ncbi:MAG: DUF4886 domain-containing protein [Muribaculaceae bacterium]|nr:DUF4886 domain-containing protein [Muribaculaceae bacterium]